MTIMSLRITSLAGVVRAVTSQQPADGNAELNERLGDAHRLGAASESLFRRLYRGLGRGRLEAELRSQLRQQRAEGAQLRRRYERLESESQRRASELNRLSAALRSLDEGLIAQDLSGKVTLMNQAAQDMLGGKRNFWGSALGALFEHYRDISETTGELTPLGEASEIQLNQRVVRARLAAIGDGGGRRIGTLIILRDQTREALAQRLQDGFVSQIARELEGPAGIIRLASELLGAQPEDAEVNQRLLGKLLRNVDILDQLALELLDLSRLKAAAADVKREPIDIERALWTVMKGVEPEVKGRGVDLLVMTRGLSGLRARGDDARLHWALGHLIRNGAQYNREGGYVALAARSEHRGGKDYALLSVSDDGPGLSAADLAGALAGGPGAGQSLSVAKAICEAHGGFLEARSRVGIGSVFTMGLPVFDPANWE